MLIVTIINNYYYLGIQCEDSSLTKCDVTLPCDFGIYCAYSIEQLLDKYNVGILFNNKF